MIKTTNKEYLRERIYGSITILALNISIYTNIEHTTVKTAFISILTTSFWLWLAAVFSEILAHHIVEKEESIKCTPQKQENVLNTLWILDSTKMSILLIFIAFLWFINLKTAILTSIITTIIYFLFMLYFITVKKEKNIWFGISIFIVQVIIFLIILNLKSGH